VAILVTGGSGFVGLNLLERLLGEGEAVVSLAASPPPEAALADFRALPGRLTVAEGDVRDADLLAGLWREHGIDRVIHAAAITAGPERDAAEPLAIAGVNHLGTLAVLEAARRHGVRRFLYVGTGSVYGSAGLLPSGTLEEMDPVPVPASLYGISKYAAERSCLRLKALWGLDLVVARLAMVFGRWEHETGLRDRMSLLLQCVRLAAAGREAVVPAGEFRDWIYAPDVADALTKLLAAPKLRHELYNVGTGVPITPAAWCAQLAERYPGFRWRVSEEAEELTAVPLAGGRTPFSARRLREAIPFRTHTLDAAFADYMDWLERHPDAATAGHTAA
jgi:nucleoside-diphosphate-sugar epimerase